MSSSMYLLFALLVSLPGVLSKIVLSQIPISDRVSEGESVTLTCDVQGLDVMNNGGFWYRQAPGQAPAWILVHWARNSIDRGDGFTDRFVPSRDASSKSYVLTINQVTLGDFGVYYCAVWSSGLTFGPGTSLNIQSSQTRAPSILLLPPSPAEMLSGVATISCLVSDFIPGFARVTWTIGGSETRANVTTSEARLASDKTYHLSSYLRVSTALWNNGGVFSCGVNHGSSTSPVLKSINSTACSH